MGGLDLDHDMLDKTPNGDSVDFQLGLILEKLDQVLSEVLVEVAGPAEPACCCETLGQGPARGYLPPWGTTSLLSLSGS